MSGQGRQLADGREPDDKILCVGYHSTITNDARTTTGHDEIQRWVEDTMAAPAGVHGTGGDGPGTLRCDSGLVR